VVKNRMARLGPICVLFVGLFACGDEDPVWDAREPARGPGVMAGSDTPIHVGPFRGGNDVVPSRRGVTPPIGPEPPDCDAGCRAHCSGAGLENPVNAGICTSLWGVGLDTRPIETAEACRRLFADTLGRFPDLAEIGERCLSRPWGDVVRELIDSDEFVLNQQRRWADRLLYNNEALSPARIYDADVLVAKLYRGLVPYDQFAAIIASHPVITRRYATSADRAEAAFRLFLGRPPFESERADLARLYALWVNDYYEHPSFGRVPDSFIQYRCVDDEGARDASRAGECASVLWGYHELILLPDARSLGREDGRLWSGLLTADEWEQLTLPGRLMTGEPAFWERAVDDVLDQYLGYKLAATAPRVREELIDYLLEHGADIRSVHFAVLSSALYLQSAGGGELDPIRDSYRYTWGPLKQAEVETWVDTLEASAGIELGGCDHRLPDPDRLLRLGTIGGYALVDDSRWQMNDKGDGVRKTYRDLARGLGGCPENLAGGRFKTVSVLTTATQEGFVANLCNPALLESTRHMAPLASLLPSGMPAQRALDTSVAREVLAHQIGRFFAREPSADEVAAMDTAVAECAPKPCTAEAFARPLCFALLSSAEMLFY